MFYEVGLRRLLARTANPPSTSTTTAPATTATWVQAEAGGELGMLAATLSSVASEAACVGPRGSSTYTYPF